MLMVYEFVTLVGDGHPAGSRLGPRAAPHSDGRQPSDKPSAV